MSIEEDVAKRVTPSKREASKIQRIAQELMDKATRVAKRLDIEVEPLLVGSIVKDTFLPNPDIDLFLVFPPSTSRSDLEKYGLRIGNEILRGEERYAEHPYVHGLYKGLGVDIVPCYRVKKPSERMSAVDRTPFHTKYIMETLGDWQRKEVRLIKQFLKGIGVYGAEAVIQGFSGYLCELLVLKYGTFRSVVENAGEWEKGVVITFDGCDQEFDNPLVVVDPVDPGRNVASALSLDNFSFFVHACREYLRNPRIEFFFPNKFVPLSPKKTLREMGERGYFLGMVFEKPSVVDDVLYPQLRKCEKTIRGLCQIKGYKIHSSSFFVDSEVVLIFEFEVHSLPKTRRHVGPPVWHSNAPIFLEKWRASRQRVAGPYILDGRWVVDVERRYTNPRELIRAHVEHLNLGKNINPVVKKKLGLLEGKEILERYHQYLALYLDKRFPWEY